MTQIGHIFEAELQKVFRQLGESHLLQWHRFPDTRAAGSIIAEQPSDYIIGLPPGSRGEQRLFFLEAKASEKDKKLQKGAIRPAQRGAIHRFRYLLDLPYLVIFWNSDEGFIELWDGIAIVDDRLDVKHRLAKWPDCGTVNKLRTAHVAACLSSYFLIPSSSATLKNLRESPQN
jgi:hypothetical protein